MIKKAESYHKEQMISLWSNAFGDSGESVSKYLDTLLKYFLVYEENGVVKGMLSVLPVKMNDKNGGYIYAVVTHPDYRGRGICKELIDRVKADKNFDFLVLVPQNKGLFDFYGKMAFVEVRFLEKARIVITNYKNDNYSLQELSPAEYEKARNDFYTNGDFIRWDSSILEFAKNMYGGEFYKILKGGETVGITFLYKEKRTVNIKELLCEKHRECAKIIGELLEAENVEFAYESEDWDPTFMAYPKEYANTKFGIYLD